MNIRLRPMGISPATILAMVEGVDAMRARQACRERFEAERTRSHEAAAETRHRNHLESLGLTEDEWPEYQAIRTAHGLTPTEAAGVVIRSRREG